jgi:hypothetical protein
VAAIAKLILFKNTKIKQAATMSGSRHLAGATCTLFGIFGFYALAVLFEHNDAFTAALTDQLLFRIRVGYAFSWFAAIAAYLSNIPVYASPDPQIGESTA